MAHQMKRIWNRGGQYSGVGGAVSRLTFQGSKSIQLKFRLLQISSRVKSIPRISLKRLLATLLPLISSSLLATATPGNGMMTLTTPTSTENKLSVTISGQAGGLSATDTKTTNVSGDVIVAMDIDPTTGGSNKFTISNGNISLTNMNFSLKALGFITVASRCVGNQRCCRRTHNPQWRHPH
jgi:hypothetical protein